MSEESPKNRRRRRRPRASSKAKTKPKVKEAKAASSGAKSSSRRKRPRKRGGGKAKDRKDVLPLTVQKQQDHRVTPINKDIFIYTYTLRPRSLLDQYQAGPNVAERMEFEQTDETALVD